MEYIIFLSEIIFFIGLVTGSIASIMLWKISRSFAKNLEKNLPDMYTKKFINLRDTNKYKNLNISLQQLVNKAENGNLTEKEIKEVQKNFFLSDDFASFFLKEINSYVEKIQKWKRLGKISVILFVSGGILFLISFYISKI